MTTHTESAAEGLTRRAALGSIASLAAVGRDQAQVALAADRPNVLLIMSDQHRADVIGAYGNPVVRTPNLDRLATGGTRFTNHWTQHPVCMPSRASIFTGRYPTAHGVRTNGVRLPAREITMAEMFRRAGYATGGAGKFHFIPHLPDRLPTMETHPEPYYGFQEFHLGEDGRRGEHAQWIRREYPQWAGKPDHEIPLELHNSSWVASHTVDFIRKSARGSQPFFAFASFVDPHHPYDPPSPYREMYKEADMPRPVFRAGEHDNRPPFYREFLPRFRQNNERVLALRAQYYGEVTFIDDSIGRILACLDELKLRENTLIVFTSDHGDALGDHLFWYKGAYHFRCCASTPLIVNWPGKVAAGKMVAGMAQEIDILPTVAALTGTTPPPGVQGRSHASLLTGSATDTGYTSALIQYMTAGVTLPNVDNSWEPAELCSLVTPEWRMSYYPGRPYGEIYSFTEDPAETMNLWDSPKHEAVRRRLRDELLDRLMAAHDPLPLREESY